MPDHGVLPGRMPAENVSDNAKMRSRRTRGKHGGRRARESACAEAARNCCGYARNAPISLAVHFPVGALAQLNGGKPMYPRKGLSRRGFVGGVAGALGYMGLKPGGDLLAQGFGSFAAAREA